MSHSNHYKSATEAALSREKTRIYSEYKAFTSNGFNALL